MPAYRRSEDLRREREESRPPTGLHRPERKPAQSGPDPEPGTPQHRSLIIYGFMTMLGMSREKAEEKYDRQLAEWQAAQSGPE